MLREDLYSVMMDALTALIIDANARNPGLAMELENAGFQGIEAADSGDGVRQALRESPANGVICEAMPPLAGVEMPPSLRCLTNSPIITVGIGGEMPELQALLNGADVYLASPVNPREFMALIRAHLCRNGGANPG